MIQRSIRTTVGSMARFVVGMAIALSLSSCPWVTNEAGVFHCYLTWMGDTSTTMTVNFHTPVPGGVSQVRFDIQSRGGNPDAYLFEATGQYHTVPWLGLLPGADRAIHVVELSDLIPGQTYYFVAGNDDVGYTPEMKFRTVPDDGSMRFVAGGDIGTGEWVDDLYAQAAAQDPMLTVIGGDIAYANGQLGNWGEWEKWLDLYETHMIRPDGCLIPIVAAIGNHEAATGFGAVGDPARSAPFYFGYFAQDGFGTDANRRSYFARQLGPSAKLLILDTNHVAPAAGEQQDWIEAELAATPGDVYTFAAYHVPLFPSHRSFGPLSESQLVRPFWQPLFDAYGLTAGFENHDHMHKRTKPLRNSAPHPDGTVYLGDGCFGKSPRDGDQAQALDDPAELERLGLAENYLANWSSRRHFWLVEIGEQQGGVAFTAIDETGTTFDSYTIDPAP